MGISIRSGAFCAADPRLKARYSRDGGKRGRPVLVLNQEIPIAERDVQNPNRVREIDRGALGVLITNIHKAQSGVCKKSCVSGSA